ncbi:MAG TPA: hypothetical protein VEV81_11570, partial [Pyrinomonadaceae bacterium]|nr:hypothetical protein [Pyrinomonadaceae bacterium]
MRDDRPSATAYLIARSTYFLWRDPLLGHLVPGRAAELSRRFARARRGLSKRLDGLSNSKCFRPLAS